MGRLENEIARLRAQLGGAPPELGDLSDMHPLLRRKIIDEARGFANHTQPPNLQRFYALYPHLREGGEYNFRYNWTVCYGIEHDVELLDGAGQGFELACYEAEYEGVPLMELRTRARERLGGSSRVEARGVECGLRRGRNDREHCPTHKYRQAGLMDPLVAFQDALEEFVNARTAWAATHPGGDAPDRDEKELYLAAKRVLARELPEGAGQRADAEHLRSVAAGYLSAFERLRESLADVRRTVEAIAAEEA